jgi:hypothetical protein
MIDLITVREELKAVEYTPEGNVTFKFASGDMGALKDEDIIAFAQNKFKDIDLILKCLLVLNYYQNAQSTANATAVNVTTDNWVVKNVST